MPRAPLKPMTTSSWSFTNHTPFPHAVAFGVVACWVEAMLGSPPRSWSASTPSSHLGLLLYLEAADPRKVPQEWTSPVPSAAASWGQHGH